MSLTLANPTNSFIRFNEPEAEPQCGQSISLCLPIMLESDVRFQVVITTDIETFALYARVVSSCNEALAPPDDKIVLQQFTSTLLSGGGLESRDKTYLMTLNFLYQEDIDALQCGQCCYIQLWFREYTLDIENPFHDSLLACSNCFQKICDPCWTSVIAYRCDEDAFGFQYYQVSGGGPTNLLANFFNSIRLPFYLKEPQFPKKKNVFIKSDGSRKTLSSRIEKVYNAYTDYMPENWHERLVIALEHDTVMIESVDAPVSPALQFTCESQYEIDWQHFLNYPTAPAKFKVNLTPYNNYNSNCN